MPSVVPSDMFVNALQLLGVIGSGEIVPKPEDTELCRRAFNRMFSRWNTRRRTSPWIDTQQLTFASTKQKYTIGLSTNNPVPDFSLTDANGSAQDRPAALEPLAQLIIQNNVELQISVINWDIYKRIPAPTLAGAVPQCIYYQPTAPNGTLWIWLEPNNFTYKLQIHWRHQITQITDVTAAISMADGQEDAMTLTLAENIWVAFPKRTDLEEIKRLARLARADYFSNSEPPPHIETTGGATQDKKGGFNWRTHVPG
jgi:hypothetical protein